VDILLAIVLGLSVYVQQRRLNDSGREGAIDAATAAALQRHIVNQARALALVVVTCLVPLIEVAAGRSGVMRGWFMLLILLVRLTGYGWFGYESFRAFRIHRARDA